MTQQRLANEQPQTMLVTQMRDDYERLRDETFRQMELNDRGMTQQRLANEQQMQSLRHITDVIRQELDRRSPAAEVQYKAPPQTKPQAPAAFGEPPVYTS